MKKKGVTPVIATVLLVSIVVVIALIVFLWLKGMTEETITKFEGTNIKLVCEDVEFEASYSENTLYLKNLGNVPIFKMKMKIDAGTSFSTITFEEEDGWPKLGLNQGGTTSIEIASKIGGAGEIVLTPVLAGSSKEGERTYTCEERHGKKIIIE
jgi:flagellin-like protein